MRDYAELVKALRTCKMSIPCTECPFYSNGDEPSKECATMNVAAADAIEELLRKIGAKDSANEFGRKRIENLQAENEELLAKVPHWISVEDELPENEESVFVVRKFLGIKGQVPPSTYTEIAYRIGDRWFADSDEYKIARSRHTDPLYWMPLPEPPNGVE